MKDDVCCVSYYVLSSCYTYQHEWGGAEAIKVQGSLIKDGDVEESSDNNEIYDRSQGI